MAIDSLAPFSAEMSLISGGTVIDLEAHNFLQSIEMEIVTRGAWKATIVLFDPQGDRLENLVLAAGQGRQFNFAFGRGSRFPTENQEFEGRVAFYQPLFESHGITLTLDVIPANVMEAALDKQLRGFGEGQRVSDIVAQIAADRGWSTVQNGQGTIEPTIDVVKEPFPSNGESDFRFVDQYLRPQARNQQGEGGYLFYVDPRGDVVHFHTPGFLSPVSHRFRYARDGSGDVISFQPSDTSVFGALMGGGNSVFGGLSSVAGGSAEATSTQTGGVEGEGVPVESDGGSVQDLGEGTHAFFDVTTRDPEELRRLAQDRFDTFRRAAYQADMEVYGTHRVAATEFVDIEYIKRDGNAHYLSGRFRVFKVIHNVDNGDWKTSYECMRGTIPGQTGTQVVSATTVNTPRVSPGSGFGVSVGVET